jgi:glycosyltransferase involved in cell wall biosynthesis
MSLNGRSLTSAKAKVVHITTVHQPADVRIYQREAVTLAERGYEVTLIACTDSSSELNGVRVRALPRPRGRVERMTRTAARAFHAALNERADIYHFHDPELVTVGLLLKLFGKTVVYDVHEDAAKDIYDKPYLPALIKPMLRVLVSVVERMAVRWFDAIVAATAAIAAKFPPDRTILLRNVPKLQELAADSGTPFGRRPRTVAYVGGLAPFNGPEQMIRAMGLLPADSDIRLVLGGRPSSADDDARFRRIPGNERVDFVGWVDRDRLRRIYADARAGLVVYQPTPNTMECEPNKFFEVLSAGVPLIASDLPHWRKFVQQHGCGLVVPPNDPAEIANAILALVNDPVRAEEMGSRGRAAVEREYNWEAESVKLLELYQRLLGDPSAVRIGAPALTSQS